jgi:hypothetical protein
MPADYADSSDNNVDLVQVLSDGTFYMVDGMIAYNRNCGVAVNGGNFEMNGGEIHSNVAMTDGGGIIVNGGVFTMNGGAIRNNRATLGGGVRLWSTATFIMAGGMVYGSGAGAGLANTASWSGASLSIGGGNAYWGDGTTSIPSKYNQNGTLRGGTPTGTVE